MFLASHFYIMFLLFSFPLWQIEAVVGPQGASTFQFSVHWMHFQTMFRLCFIILFYVLYFYVCLFVLCFLVCFVFVSFMSYVCLLVLCFFSLVRPCLDYVLLLDYVFGLPLWQIVVPQGASSPPPTTWRLRWRCGWRSWSTGCMWSAAAWRAPRTPSGPCRPTRWPWTKSTSRRWVLANWY